MNIKLLVSLIGLLFSLSSYCQSDSLRVLFLGNSYTAVNNLPQITQNLAAAANKTLIIDANTPGGYTLEGHSTNATSLSKIRQGNWDFIVLQEQSQIPTIDYYRYNSMVPGAERLNDTIKKYNPCTNVVLYMTWGRRFGGQQCDQGGVNCSPVFVDFSHMQDSLESAYTELAENLNAYVAPVGIAWKKVIEDTSIVLHSADNSHPNFNGSYLAACVFHSVFWNESPVGLLYTGALSNSVASYFQQVADSTVFHSYSGWNLTIDAVTADFSFDVYTDSVQFTNLSESLSPSSYFWDFGDGTTLTAENPSHIYASNQTYTVSLAVAHCSKKDTAIKTVTITTLGIEPQSLVSFINVFPNPVGDVLRIEINKKQVDLTVQLLNSNGENIQAFQVSNNSNFRINFEALPKGLYLLKLYDKNSNQDAAFKIVKY